MLLKEISGRISSGRTVVVELQFRCKSMHAMPSSIIGTCCLFLQTFRGVASLVRTRKAIYAHNISDCLL